MSEPAMSSPAICVDLKRLRIRIHRKTLRAIGNPEYVLLLINPDEVSIALLRGNQSDPKAHRVKAPTSVGDSFELCSMSLLQKLPLLCDKFKTVGSYRLYGEIIQGGEAVLFRLNEAEKISGAAR